MSKVIGIDLGTTNSCMAVMEGGEPTVIPNAEGGRTTPSVVAFAKDGQRLVGTPAKRQAVTNPKNTVFSIKRFMGRKASEVSEEQKIVPYEVVSGPNGDARVKADDKTFPPPEISAMILQKLKTDAEAYLGEPVAEAVITVPAYFNDAQRNATKDAGKIAGLNVLRIINEPTAASLAYGLDKEGDQTILVFDLGGGTFDVSILELGEGVFEVKATSGDNHLGGDNFDKAIVDWLIAEFKRDQGIDLGVDPMALQRLYEAGEKAKIELSTTQSTNINLPFITAGADGPKHLDTTLSRAKLTELTHDLVERTVGPTKQALSDAGLVAVGDRPGDPGRRHDAHAGRAGEGQGADRQGSAPGRQPRRGRRRRRRHPGRRAQGRGQGRAAARRDPAVAGHRDQGRRLHQADRPQHDHPDAQVGDLLDRRRRAAVRRDPRAAGRARDGLLQQDAGQVPAGGHPAGTARRAEIEVTFDIDANGIMHVSAKDSGSGNEQKIQIQGGSGLSDSEVESMVSDAEAHAEDDRRLRDLAEARNSAEQVVYATEKSLSEHEEKLDEDTKSDIKGKIEAVRTSLEGDDAADIRTKLEALREASFKLGELVYQQAQAAGSTGASGANGETADDSEEEIVDAEVVDEAETGDRA